MRFLKERLAASSTERSTIRLLVRYGIALGGLTLFASLNAYADEAVAGNLGDAMGWTCRTAEGRVPEVVATVWKHGTSPQGESLYSIQVREIPAGGNPPGIVLAQSDQSHALVEGDALVYEGASLRGGAELSIPNAKSATAPMDLGLGPVSFPGVLTLSRAILGEGAKHTGLEQADVYDTFCEPAR